MKITVHPAERLTAEHVRAWSLTQRADPALASPFFRPEFTLAVASARSDVEVAVIENHEGPVGFFPFQRTRWNMGKPVGGRLSDFQGGVVQPGVEWNAIDLIRACGLAAWDFDHLLASQDAFRPHHFRTAVSPYMDLSGGLKSYRDERCAAGSMLLTDTMRKARKLEREVGPIRFEAHTSDRAVFDALLAWKSDQYVRTGVTNVFAFPWTLKVLERVLSAAGDEFGGIMSALYAGERLISAHLGLRAREVVHFWFPAYDPAFGKYSPGLILLIEFAKAAASLGIERVDLGKGDTRFKTSLMSGATLVAEGTVALNLLVRGWRRGWENTRAWVRSSALRGPARLAARFTRPVRGWLAFR